LDDDPEILRESGLLAECAATIYASSQAEAGRSWTGGDGRVLGQVLDRRRTWLDDAATWLGRAAALEPGNDEVLVHLGRVRALKFEDAEALSTLGAVLERTRSDDLGYLAAIFIGAVHDRQGRLEEAAGAYRAALDRVPRGHTGRVGLADVLRRSGRVDEARGLLRALVADQAEGIREPFWWYVLEPPGMADARLAALRTEVRR
jgi:tetratricopeptide (TPR) repeat protein